jgi:DNA polymerase I-like protein with 3'-5' exonuclease and polymerase domains
MFVSRFGPNGRIVEVDYTALEVVTLAAASGDFNLLDKILNNTDMHLYRLAGADNNYLGKTYDDLVDIHNNKQNALYHAIHEARTNIKPKAFAAQYGASATGISFATGCTVEDAQAFLDNEAKLFPAATAFKFIMKEEVERTGAAQSSVHREQTAEGQWSLYRRGYYTAPGGTRYSFRQFPKWSGGKQIMDYKETQIANYAIQGESSLIVQIATGRVLRWLIAEDFFDGQVLPISTTHDSVYLDCANSDLAVIAGIKTKEIMESTPAYMCTFMPAYKEWNYHTTPFKAVAEMGPSMASKEVIK